jgi:hypothetical protein
MNWLKSKLRSWIFDQDSVAVEKSTRLFSTRDIDHNGMNFTIMNAVGGYVMQYSQYDEKNDRNDRRLHIITSDQDLGQSIAHIITYEMLRK